MFSRVIRVRYSECDAQGVLFNSHYLAFCDHVMDDLLLEALGSDSDLQLMVKSAALNWTSPAKYRDEVTVAAEFSRWGTSSFDVAYRMTIDERILCEAVVTYVHVEFVNAVPTATAIPVDVRDALSNASNGS